MMFRRTWHLIVVAHLCFAGGTAVVAAEEQESEKLVLSIRFDKTKFSYGERILCTVCLANKGKKAAAVLWRPGLRRTILHVTGPTGDNSRLTMYGEMVLRPKVARTDLQGGGLEPGQKSEYVVELNRLYDMTLNGTYRVLATRNLSGGRGRIQSSVVEIQITEPGDSAETKRQTKARP